MWFCILLASLSGTYPSLVLYMHKDMYIQATSKSLGLSLLTFHYLTLSWTPDLSGISLWKIFHCEKFGAYFGEIEYASRKIEIKIVFSIFPQQPWIFSEIRGFSLKRPKWEASQAVSLTPCRAMVDSGPSSVKGRRPPSFAGQPCSSCGH